MNTKLSLRQLWTIYKRTSVAQGFANTKRDLALSHVAFYSGARGVLRVLDYMIEHGDTEGAVRTIQRFGRQIKSDPRAAHTSAESALIRRAMSNERPVPTYSVEKLLCFSAVVDSDLAAKVSVFTPADVLELL